MHLKQASLLSKEWGSPQRDVNEKTKKTDNFYAAAVGYFGISCPHYRGTRCLCFSKRRNFLR